MIRNIREGETGWDMQNDCMAVAVRAANGSLYLAMTGEDYVEGARDIITCDDGSFGIKAMTVHEFISAWDPHGLIDAAISQDMTEADLDREANLLISGAEALGEPIPYHEARDYLDSVRAKLAEQARQGHDSA